MCDYTAITGSSAELEFSALLFMPTMTTMVIIIANTYNGPGSALSFISSNSLSTHASPTRAIPIFSHFTDEAHTARSHTTSDHHMNTYPWSGVESPPPPSSPGICAGQEAPE